MAGLQAAATSRHASHAAHAGTFLILLATGVLLFSPTIRSRFVGGYSLYLRSIHCWTGVLFALATLPFLKLARRPGSTPRDRRANRSETASSLWRRAHLLFTIGATAAFTATGVLLWPRGRFGWTLTDASATAHLWLTYAAAGVLAGHLCVAAVGLRRPREHARVRISPLYEHDHLQSGGVDSCS